MGKLSKWEMLVIIIQKCKCDPRRRRRRLNSIKIISLAEYMCQPHRNPNYSASVGPLARQGFPKPHGAHVLFPRRQRPSRTPQPFQNLMGSTTDSSELVEEYCHAFTLWSIRHSNTCTPLGSGTRLALVMRRLIASLFVRVRWRHLPVLFGILNRTGRYIPLEMPRRIA